jgi:hypothetical protein
MQNSLITQADEIYRYSQESNPKYRNIEYPELFVYTKNLSFFFNNLGDIQKDDYWKERKRRLRKLAFLFTSAPLDKAFLLKKINTVISFLEIDVINCKKLYPVYAAKYEILLENIKAILATELEVMKLHLDDVIETLEGSIAVLIKDTRVIPIIEKIYSNQNIYVISINSLRHNITYDNIIVVGSASVWWFPDFIFSSPRAKNIYVVKFRWMKDSWQPKTVFPNPIISTDEVRVILENDVSNEHDEYIDPELLLPIIDFSSIMTSAWKQAEEENELEHVEAIIGHLENDQIVFLDYSDSSTIRIIDIEDEEKPVKKTRVKELTSEMFLLLKTSGGGDYIVPLANKILGDNFTALRDTQKRWKNCLRKKENEKGIDWLVNEFVSRGCSIANPINLRNWMSYRSIKTSQFLHFKIIIEVIGLQEQAQDIWNQMSLITQAHIKAGRHITKLLLMMARETDLDELMRLGIMEFELPDKDAGSITAYRIKALSDRHKTVLVSPTKIGIPLDLE